MPRLLSPCAIAKTQRSQINKILKQKNVSFLSTFSDKNSSVFTINKPSLSKLLKGVFQDVRNLIQKEKESFKKE